MSWGLELGKEAWWKKVTERRGKRNTPNILLPSPHDFIKNWVFSKSSQDLLPQGEKKKKRQAPSVYFLGWKPEQIQQIFTQGPSHV